MNSGQSIAAGTLVALARGVSKRRDTSNNRHTMNSGQSIAAGTPVAIVEVLAKEGTPVTAGIPETADNQ